MSGDEIPTSHDAVPSSGDEKAVPMKLDFVHDPIHILELQITCTTLQNEVLMRYVTSPKTNLDPIRRILERTFVELAALSVPRDAVRCPDGWVHKMCRCVVPTLKNLSYKSETEDATDH